MQRPSFARTVYLVVMAIGLIFAILYFVHYIGVLDRLSPQQ